MQETGHAAEAAAGAFGDRRTKVWLECNGEPYDYRSVQSIRIRKLSDDIEMVEFTCPRCGRRHQSLRYT